LHIETWAVFCNGTYLYDFIIENDLSQKALQNATSIIFADARQIYFIINNFKILNPDPSLAPFLNMPYSNRFDVVANSL
jgi:hypothetical protein